MHDSLKTELKLFLAEALTQVTGNEEFIYGLLRLDTKQRFILRERRKMTTDLWFAVLRHYNWTCLKCGVRNLANHEWGKPKIEADHVTSLFHGGRTVFANLQTLCKLCNQQKGIKTIDYRR